jgi:hypothetical protein
MLDGVSVVVVGFTPTVLFVLNIVELNFKPFRAGSLRTLFDESMLLKYFKSEPLVLQNILPVSLRLSLTTVYQ